MLKTFTLIQPESIEDNVFKLIGSDWMLICSGAPSNYNMMTASWGFAGVLWRKPVAVVFVRPQRHTYSFIDSNPYFTLSFFEEESRDLLNLCGTVSGRDLNKMNLDGLTPMITPQGNVAFEESRLVLECRKLYYDDIKPELFQVFELELIYPSEDYHRFFMGEITGAWKKNYTSQ